MPCKKKGNPRPHTPITSGSQQGAMGVAYAALKGDIPISELGGPAQDIAKSMSKADLRSHLIESGGKSLPDKSKGVRGNTHYETKLLSG